MRSTQRSTGSIPYSAATLLTTAAGTWQSGWAVFLPPEKSIAGGMNITLKHGYQRHGKDACGEAS